MKRILQRPWLIIAVVVLITIYMAIQIPGIVLDNDVKIYFPKDHPSYQRIMDLDDVYESQIMLDICITDTTGSFLNADTVNFIAELTEEVEELEHVDSVTSLVNTDFPEGSIDGMVVGKLVEEDFTGTDAELAEIRRKLQDWPDMYENSLYSEDFSTTQILVTIDEDIDPEQMSTLYQEVQQLVGGHDELDIRVAGDPVLTEKAKEFMYSDLSKLIPIVILVLLLCLYLSFHSIGGTILPMLTVMITTIWTVALMAIFDVSFTVVSTCLPVLLIAIGSAYGIHVMNSYYFKKRNTLEQLDAAKHKQLVIDSVSHVLKPVMLAGFTTIVGFSSILTSPIVPLKSFGLFSSIGVLIALVLSITFIPSLVIVSHREHEKALTAKIAELKKRRQQKSHDRMNAIYEHVSKRQTAVLTISILAIAVSWYGLSQMNIESALIEYFPKDSSIRVDSDYISKTMAGTNTFNVIIRGENPGDVIDPAVLSEMDGLKQHLLAGHEEIGKIMSYSDFIKRMNQVMNYPTESAESDEYAYEEGSEDLGGDSFFDEVEDEDASFFSEGSTDDSFFAEEEGSSFFDIEADEELSAAETANAGYESIPLDQTITWEDLSEITQAIIHEGGEQALTVESLAEGILRACNYRGAAFYEIPSDPNKYPADTREELKNLISQYLLLYSGSLESFSDDMLEPTQVRMLIEIRSYDTAVIADIIDDIDEYAKGHFADDIAVENTGLAEMTKVLTDMVTSSQINSLLSALIAVLIIVAIAYHSPIAGLFGIIPLSLSILINFGIMGLTGINLDMVTALIASIAIGVGVDYTIHFLSCYAAERKLSSDLNEVTRNTVLSTGKAIITNAVSVGLGFAVLTLSEFVVLRYIGILVAIIMITSSLAALTVLPALLNWLKPKFITKNNA